MAESAADYFKRLRDATADKPFDDGRVKGGTSAANQPADSPDNYFRKLYKTNPKNVTTNPFLKKGAEVTQKHFDKLSNIRRDDSVPPGIKKPKTVKRTTTAVMPTERPQATVATSRPKAVRGVQSWRGGDVPGQIRYDPGTKPNPTKKQRSSGVHDTKGLKWFKGRD